MARLAVSLPTLFACLLLLCTFVYCSHNGDIVTVEVDPENGDDDLCMSAIEMVRSGINSYPAPCATLNFAVRGNLSLGNISLEDCTDETDILHNVRIVLSSGIHQLTEYLILGSSRNITFLANSTSGAVPIVRCTSHPNYDFDNIFSCGVEGLQFEGITFEECGPVSSNVFIYGGSDVTFNSCVFRNNSGTSLQIRFTETITISNCSFYNNINNVSVTTESNETTIEDLYRRVQTSGGVTIFLQNQMANIQFNNCNFQYNRASRNPENDTRPVLLKQNGHGGAILIRLSGVYDSTVDISNSNFVNNYAEVDGGGLYVSYSDGADSNTFLFRNLNFTSNIVEEAAGGAISMNSFNFTFNNRFLIEDCQFINNIGSAGGAVSMALYDSNLNSTERPDGINFTKCEFSFNSAINEGTAVGLFSLVHVDQVGFPVNFSDCDFMNNTSSGGKDTSAVAAFRFPTEFSGTNEFTGNVGGGIMLLNTRMLARGTLLFYGNRAMFGGGIMMDDRCLLEVTPNVTMTFEENYAVESGGGIYVEFPPIRFVIDIFNRLCFLQYTDNSGQDKSPQEWEGVHINFIRNKARLSGAAIYASDMQRCSWLGNDYADQENTLIFRPPPELNISSPFYYEDNTLEVKINNDSVRVPELATAPLNIHPSVKFDTVQPGERLAITLNATDQLNNTREAVWALDDSIQDTTLDALSADNDTYFYTVPSMPSVGNRTANDSDNNSNITLDFSLLKTLGLSNSLNLLVASNCHPGFKQSDNSCVCNIGPDNILRCDDDNRYVYLREGIWGYSNKGRDGFITARVLPGYTTCTQQGRLPGCLYMFDGEDEQCIEGREGILCGQCKKDYGVTLDLQSCTKQNCAAGQVLFILLSCFGLFIICFLVLWFDVPIPNELKAFIFYAQVIGLVYRPFSVVTTQSTRVNAISVILNLLGFSNPLPVCISRSIGAEYVALLGYIPPLIIISTVIGFGVGARFIKQFAHHSALKGITTLSVFFYKYIADTSFVFLSCVSNDLGFVFQYDGSVNCLTPYFGFFFVLALLIVTFFVAPLPFFVSFVCLKRPQSFQAYADVLTDGLRARHHWWGGWDIGRRLPFVLISFFVVLARPSLILFFMSISALVVMLVHIFSKPYENKYTNIIEAAILLDLLLVTGAFLDPSSEQVPEWFSYTLVFLPYAYCIGYICWVIGKRIKKHVDSRRGTTEPNKEGPPPVEGTGTPEEGSDRLTGSSIVTGTTIVRDTQRSRNTDEDTLDTTVKLREPLLDDL